MSATPELRLLVVHAHPDDEAISTGVTLAKYAQAGAGVTLVTCTSGEEGEILVPHLAHLAADKDDALGEHRRKEMQAALAALGVRDHRYLGGEGKYRDSGMAGTPSNTRSDSFMQADLLQVAKDLVQIIREVKPQVVVTYDDFGGYGHPDHIQAHRAVHYAVDLAAIAGFAPELGKPWRVSKLYWTAIPRSFVQTGIERMIEAGNTRFFGVTSADELPFVVDDSLVTTCIRAPELVPQKMAALRAHQTQVEEGGDFFLAFEQMGPEAWGNEFYRLVGGSLFGGAMVGGAPDELESDLFAGVK